MAAMLNSYSTLARERLQPMRTLSPASRKHCVSTQVSMREASSAWDRNVRRNDVFGCNTHVCRLGIGSSGEMGKREGAQTKSLKHPERHFGSPIEIF